MVIQDIQANQVILVFLAIPVTQVSLDTAVFLDIAASQVFQDTQEFLVTQEHPAIQDLVFLAFQALLVLVEPLVIVATVE